MLDNPPPLRPNSIIIMQIKTAEHTFGRGHLDWQPILRLNNIINFISCSFVRLTQLALFTAINSAFFYC